MRASGTGPTVARINMAPSAVRRVVDLGCGPGNSTAVVAARYPDAPVVVGVDNSPEMLRQALATYPQWSWEEADIAAWARSSPAPYDIVLSNATLQWLPDHAALLPALWSTVAPGGVLALQMPRNFDAPSHTVMAAVAREGPWAAKLEGARETSFTQPPSFYYDVLAPLAADVTVWETEYIHVLPSAASVVDWLRGTGLRPFLARLDADEQSAFLRQYSARIADAYPVRSSGCVLFPFRRTFVVARRHGGSGAP